MTEAAQCQSSVIFYEYETNSGAVLVTKYFPPADYAVGMMAPPLLRGRGCAQARSFVSPDEHSLSTWVLGLRLTNAGRWSTDTARLLADNSYWSAAQAMAQGRGGRGGQGEQVGVVVSEGYVLFHWLSGKTYAGLAYHGTLARTKEHWKDRNSEPDMCSQMWAQSRSPMEWVAWPVERFPGPRRGHVTFHKAQAHRERAHAVKGVWPYGFSTSGMDRRHHRGTRDTWKKHRQQFGAHWEEDLTQRSKKAVLDVKHMERLLHSEGERVWKEVKRTAVERCRAMLQVLEQHKKLGGELRGQIQAALLREVMAHKKKKNMPDGDFMKLLISQGQHGHKPEGEQLWATSCECFKHFVNLTNKDVWKGHVCVCGTQRSSGTRLCGNFGRRDTSSSCRWRMRRYTQKSQKAWKDTSTT